jgi:cytoplasmic iron level regulating protein YaaA (DUF328/UPF0246 family)
VLKAVLAFDGDVYDGLQARSSRRRPEWAQQHLRILSGLYGVLRPLDWMQPYRLEMGTALKVGKAPNLYQLLGQPHRRHLNERLAADKTPVVINLASQEYFRRSTAAAEGPRGSSACSRMEATGGYKVISFFAKKARGLMARYAMLKRIETPRKLEASTSTAMRFDPPPRSPSGWCSGAGRP